MAFLDSAFGRATVNTPLSYWVLAFSREPVHRKSVSYTLAMDGAKKHVIFDLAPGTYRVSSNGSQVAKNIVVKDNDFSLSFEAHGKAGDTFIVRK